MQGKCDVVYAGIAWVVQYSQNRPFSNLPLCSFLTLQNFASALFPICLKSQEKLKTMLIQNFGGTKKSIMVNSKVAYCSKNRR